MLIDVTKNETTGKYEVETDVKPTPAPGGSAIAYAWYYGDGKEPSIAYFNFDVAPDTEEEYLTKRDIEFTDGSVHGSIVNIYPCNADFGYSKQSDTQFYIDSGRAGNTYTRADSSQDIDIWTYEPSGDELEP